MVEGRRLSRSRVEVVGSVVLGSREVEFPLLRKPVPRTRGGDPVLWSIRAMGMLPFPVHAGVIPCERGSGRCGGRRSPYARG